MTRRGRISIALVLVWVGSSVVGARGSGDQLPTAPDLWHRLKPGLPPLSFTVLRDDLVPSDSRRGVMLRRVEVRFVSQIIGRTPRPMEHTAVVYVPPAPPPAEGAHGRSKVVIVGQRHGDDTILRNYGEPIASATGYPTMVLPVPGEYDGHDGESCWIYFLASELDRTSDPADHNYVRLAIPYLRALDVFERILGIRQARAVIGGHSKRATAAFTAAAMDPERIDGVVYMGNESIWEGLAADDASAIVAPTRTQASVRAKVLYVGATNEGGYRMFDINRIAAAMRNPWTIEYIPNHRHAADSEIQALAWQMWVAHVHGGRPVSRIVEASHTDVAEGTVFRARVESPNTLVQVKAWYAYTDDPYWRDLTWYPVDLLKKDGYFEGFHEGVLPDAWLVEAKDVADGIVGYVSTLPIDLTGKPARRRSGAGLPKLWRPKAGEVQPPLAGGGALSPAARWQAFKRALPPVSLERIGAAEPAGQPHVLRQDIRFRSQTIGRFRRQMDHTATILMPTPGRAPRTEVFVLGTSYRQIDETQHVAARLAAVTGRTTMVLPVPGEYDGHDGESCWPYFLRTELRDTADPADHPDFRLAVAYLRALDVLAAALDLPTVRAVAIGDGQRATAALAAAALEPSRIVGVVYGSYDQAGSDPLEVSADVKRMSPLTVAGAVAGDVLELRSPQTSSRHEQVAAVARRSVSGRWTAVSVDDDGPSGADLVTRCQQWADQVFGERLRP